MPSAKSRPPHIGPASVPKHPETVNPAWLVNALVLTFAAAGVCVYATLCLLVYQGAWQLVLHPVSALDRTPASVGLDFATVHFGAADTGQPRLTGWWIPAQSASSPNSQSALQSVPKYAAYTILYLHDGSGSLSNTIPVLARLHQAGLNIFAIDYRGFGSSDDTQHPSEARMIEDTAAALSYLTSTRHIPAGNIVPYGTGLGAFLAVNLAQAHGELPAVILDNPDPDPASTASSAHPSHLVPVRLLFGNSFNIAAPIATLTTPKLLIDGGPAVVDSARDRAQVPGLFRSAASPRYTVTLPPSGSEAAWQSALDRFLDQYLPKR